MLFLILYTRKVHDLSLLVVLRILREAVERSDQVLAMDRCQRCHEFLGLDSHTGYSNILD